MQRKAIFFDKDGTLVRDVPYNVDPAKVEWNDGAQECIHLLTKAGFDLFVVSNQSGVAHDYFREERLAELEQFFRREFRRMGGELAGFYYCPHHPRAKLVGYRMSCDCRKPRPGMIQRAAREHAIDLASSWFIGDILHDVEAAHQAGCRAVLLDNGGETEWIFTADRVPDAYAKDLASAAHLILALGKSSPSQCGA